MNKKRIILLIASIFGVLFFVAALSIGIINKIACNDTLRVTYEEFGLAGAGVIVSVIALIEVFTIKKTSLLVLIPVVGSIILGLYGSLKIFDDNNNYTLLLILLIVLVTVMTCVSEIKSEYKWASITGAVAAAILLIFILFDCLDEIANFNNPFKVCLAFGVVVLGIYSIAFNAASLLKDEEKNDDDNNSSNEVEVKSNEEAKEVQAEEAVEQKETVQEETQEEVKEEPKEENNSFDNTNDSNNESNTSNEEEKKEENNNSFPYDNSSLIGE